ncbi:MAG: fluoride efflux transporter CrcB [Marmoricola sp.]
MGGHDPRELLAIFCGGALGAVARAGLGQLVDVSAGGWPWPTFVANVVGAFLLGYFTTRLLERLPVSSYRRPLLGTGLCGGLSTFSTMQVETVRLLQVHAYGVAAGYTVASIVAGLLAIHLATSMVRRAGAAS